MGRNIKQLLAASAVVLLAPINNADAAWGDSYISGWAGVSPIEIRTCWWLAGAICSLRLNGMEFINIDDHGRELQSSVSFDYGTGMTWANWDSEVFNPNEAGSRWDGGIRHSSTSQLQGLSASGNVLSTQTQMAFWLRPGEYTAPGNAAANVVALSSHILNKQVTIGMPGMAHVIEYRTQYTIPWNEGNLYGQFESVTAYMPPSFSSFYTYDPATQDLEPLSDGPGEQSLPVILSTPDGAYAMGIYAPAHWLAGNPGIGRWRWPDTVKWNSVYRIENPYGTYHFVNYVVVGSLENVMVSMDQLRWSGY